MLLVLAVVVGVLEAHASCLLQPGFELKLFELLVAHLVADLKHVTLVSD